MRVFTEEQEAIRRDFIQHFSENWNRNDPAHRVEHFDNVALTGLLINERLGLGFPDRLIMTVAYVHDLFARYRDNHHNLSKIYVEWSGESILERYIYTEEEKKLVADACGEHRASFKGEFSSTFSELMNAADREFPQGVKGLLKRAMDYREAQSDSEPWINIYNDAIKHLKEKFGSNGYARYPKMYMDVFGNEIREQQLEVDNL